MVNVLLKLFSFEGAISLVIVQPDSFVGFLNLKTDTCYMQFIQFIGGDV